MTGFPRWSHQPDSNRRPADYKSAALPTELWGRMCYAGWLPPRSMVEGCPEGVAGLVEISGIEPLASCLRSRRSPV